MHSVFSGIWRVCAAFAFGSGLWTLMWGFSPVRVTSAQVYARSSQRRMPVLIDTSTAGKRCVRRA
jgi:hypothetical protein